MKTLIGDVPDDWRVLSLRDVCEVLAGPSGNLAAMSRQAESGVRLITPRNIDGGRITEDDLVFVSWEKAERLKRYQLEPGDVIGVRTASIGRYALAGPEHEGWLFGTACLRIRPNESVDPRYLLHYLRNPIMRDWVEQNSLKSTIASINTDTIRNLPFVIPPMSAQESIGRVLSALDEKIAIHYAISRRATDLRDRLSPLLLTGALPARREEYPSRDG